MALQKEKADVNLGVKVINFLNHVARQDPAVSQPINAVLNKWLSSNPVYNAIIHKTGPFYELVQNCALSNTETAQLPSSDHEYTTGSGSISFSAFVDRVNKDQFNILEFLLNYRPTSSDPERLFSLCRLSRNFLQCRMLPETLARNVFLNKNSHFLKKQ